jgi:hypothetical protein
LSLYYGTAEVVGIEQATRTVSDVASHPLAAVGPAIVVRRKAVPPVAVIALLLSVLMTAVADALPPSPPSVHGAPTPFTPGMPSKPKMEIVAAWLVDNR